MAERIFTELGSNVLITASRLRDPESHSKSVEQVRQDFEALMVYVEQWDNPLVQTARATALEVAYNSGRTADTGQLIERAKLFEELVFPGIGKRIAAEEEFNKRRHKAPGF